MFPNCAFSQKLSSPKSQNTHDNTHCTHPALSSPTRAAAPEPAASRPLAPVPDLPAQGPSALRLRRAKPLHAARGLLGAQRPACRGRGSVPAVRCGGRRGGGRPPAFIRPLLSFHAISSQSKSPRRCREAGSARSSSPDRSHPSPGMQTLSVRSGPPFANRQTNTTTAHEQGQQSVAIKLSTVSYVGRLQLGSLPRQLPLLFLSSHGIDVLQPLPCIRRNRVQPDTQTATVSRAGAEAEAEAEAGAEAGGSRSSSSSGSAAVKQCSSSAAGKQEHQQQRRKSRQRGRPRDGRAAAAGPGRCTGWRSRHQSSPASRRDDSGSARSNVH